MRYFSGEEVELGDHITLGGNAGSVVCLIERGLGTADYPIEMWSYLGKGFVAFFAAYGLIHYSEPEEDLKLVERASAADFPGSEM